MVLGETFWRDGKGVKKRSKGKVWVENQSTRGGKNQRRMGAENQPSEQRETGSELGRGKGKELLGTLKSNKKKKKGIQHGSRSVDQPREKFKKERRRCQNKESPWPGKNRKG